MNSRINNVYSPIKFTRGGKSITSRMISYIALYNELYPGKATNCYCFAGKFDKNTPVSDSPSQKASYAQRIAYVIRNAKGGNVQYGNFYLGQPLNVNYLGRVEGMPGGSGMPPLNRFN
jgi:hypothetical protein